MSLGLALSNALSGLNAAQRALALTSHNIANVNTEGYVRKVLGQETRVVDGTGAGVQTAEVTRIVDAFLTGELRAKNAALGRSEILDRYHTHVQGLFGAPGENRDLGARLGGLAAALEAFANAPETSALAASAIGAATELVHELGRFADDVQRLRRDADQELAREIAAVNADIAALHGLNSEIVRRTAIGQDTAELQDKRDALLLGLGERLDITTYDLGNGAIAVATRGGVALLDRAPRVLVYDPVPAVAETTVFNRIAVFGAHEIDPETGRPADPDGGVELVAAGVRAELTPELEAAGAQATSTSLRAGRIKGLLEVRDDALPRLNDQVQELAANLRFALNAAHNAGVPQPPPSTLTGTRTDLAGFAGNGAGEATLAVVDADGATVAAIAVDMGAADAATLAAQIDAGLGALGTAEITADGRLRISLADPAHGLAIDEGSSAVAVTDAAGRTRTYGFSHYFGLNDLLVQDGARASDTSVRADIAADPRRLSSARLEVDAGPPLSAGLGGVGDNRGAQALAAALTEAHEFIARGGLPSRRATLAEYAGDITAGAAVEAGRVADGLARERALLEDLSLRAASVSGVNLDEELSRLVLYQQSYSVAARVIAVTSTMFDELLAAVRR